MTALPSDKVLVLALYQPTIFVRTATHRCSLLLAQINHRALKAKLKRSLKRWCWPHNFQRRTIFCREHKAEAVLVAKLVALVLRYFPALRLVLELTTCQPALLCVNVVEASKENRIEANLVSDMRKTRQPVHPRNYFQEKEKRAPFRKHSIHNDCLPEKQTACIALLLSTLKTCWFFQPR